MSCSLAQPGDVLGGFRTCSAHTAASTPPVPTRATNSSRSGGLNSSDMKAESTADHLLSEVCRLWSRAARWFTSDDEPTRIAFHPSAQFSTTSVLGRSSSSNESWDSPACSVQVSSSRSVCS
eukprot:CAMPEP_0179912864 /NCGR_PEP_ID=MMETSP0983-20121128/130_1 /TAXON_ID=483367 /ORGANISM="non described non described, Strain CCMP 2436" /LENGTH=121 /DNA_ID=CAMNT_0021814767 /DNA_START=54 /DNA_END=419 /DNA_ORIENTATION=+